MAWQADLEGRLELVEGNGAVAIRVEDGDEAAEVAGRRRRRAGQRRGGGHGMASRNDKEIPVLYPAEQH